MRCICYSDRYVISVKLSMLLSLTQVGIGTLANIPGLHIGRVLLKQAYLIKYCSGNEKVCYLGDHAMYLVLDIAPGFPTISSFYHFAFHLLLYNHIVLWPKKKISYIKKYWSKPLQVDVLKLLVAEACLSHIFRIFYDLILTFHILLIC